MERKATIIDMGNDTFFISILFDIGFIHFLDKKTYQTVVLENVYVDDIISYQNGTPIEQLFPHLSKIEKSLLKERVEGINLNLN